MPYKQQQSKQQVTRGILYLVGTPIGNLEDMVPRALKILQSVALVAAEDTRRAASLLEHFGLRPRLISCHDHNEEEIARQLIPKLLAGEDIALVSDAGMPLISDPGYRLVAMARAEGIEVCPIPGPCAAIMALCASGLPTDRFLFLGFAPAKRSARKIWFANVSQGRDTIVYYESPHRILESLQDAALAFGIERRAMLARELTKKFESWYGGTLGELVELYSTDGDHHKGEMVMVVEGYRGAEIVAERDEVVKLMTGLIPEVGIKRASVIAAALSGQKKSYCYQVGLELEVSSAD